MNIIFFANPIFFADQIVPQFTSMPRFVKMLASGMREHGHKVEVWSPTPRFFNLPFKKTFKKYLGYIDQYVIFPAEVKRRVKKCDANSLFVFTDQAQGPWVPLTAKRRHVIHCHDFLSQYSALGKIPENLIGFTGRLYQRFIRRGFSKGMHFISDSYKTQVDLQSLLGKQPVSSDVVYIGLAKTYVPGDVQKARAKLSNKINCDLSSGYILHVGGNLWYKNRKGVIEIYNAWKLSSGSALPLILVGEPLSPTLLQSFATSRYQSDIHIITGLEDEFIRMAYTGASVLIFPSFAEGFGWPIAEAMACGCPVITTNEAPMTEVAGESGFFIPRRPFNEMEVELWAKEAADVIDEVVCLKSGEHQKIVERGLLNVKRFDIDVYISEIEKIYRKVVSLQK